MAGGRGGGLCLGEGRGVRAHRATTDAVEVIHLKGRGHTLLAAADGVVGGAEWAYDAWGGGG